MKNIAFWNFWVFVLMTVCLLSCDQTQNMTNGIIMAQPESEVPSTPEAGTEKPPVVEQPSDIPDHRSEVGELLAGIRTLQEEIAGIGNGRSVQTGNDNGNRQDNSDGSRGDVRSGDDDDGKNDDDGGDDQTGNDNGNRQDNGDGSRGDNQADDLIRIGDEVIVRNTLDLGIRIRKTPSGNQIGGMFDGETGIVISGPRESGGLTWVKIEWDAPVKDPNSGCGIDKDICIGWSAVFLKDGTQIIHKR